MALIVVLASVLTLCSMIEGRAFIDKDVVLVNIIGPSAPELITRVRRSTDEEIQQEIPSVHSVVKRSVGDEMTFQAALENPYEVTFGVPLERAQRIKRDITSRHFSFYLLIQHTLIPDHVVHCSTVSLQSPKVQGTKETALVDIHVRVRAPFHVDG